MKVFTKQPSKLKVTQPVIGCVRIFKSIIFAFSVHELQRISKLITRNSHLALKAATTSQYDVTSIILTGGKIETFKLSFLY